MNIIKKNLKHFCSLQETHAKLSHDSVLRFLLDPTASICTHDTRMERNREKQGAHEHAALSTCTWIEHHQEKQGANRHPRHTNQRTNQRTNQHRASPPSTAGVGRKRVRVQPYDMPDIATGYVFHVQIPYPGQGQGTMNCVHNRDVQGVQGVHAPVPKPPSTHREAAVSAIRSHRTARDAGRQII